MCDCNVCNTSRRLRAITEKLPEDDAEWLIEFGEFSFHVAMDRDYYHAIIQGDWPSAVPILERALKRAREKQGLEEKYEDA